MRTASPVLFPLFRSAHQAELLTAVFFAAPSDVLSLRSLSRDTGISYATVHREIGRLKDAGLVVDHRVGNTRVVRANDKSPYFEPLRTLLEVAFGAEPLLRERLARVPGVQAAALYGSYAARRSGQTGTSPVDIDVLVVGRPDMNVLYSECEEVARAVGREVNRPSSLPTSGSTRAAAFSDVFATSLASPYSVTGVR